MGQKTREHRGGKRGRCPWLALVCRPGPRAVAGAVGGSRPGSAGGPAPSQSKSMMLRVPDALFEKNFLPGGFGFGPGPLHFVLPCHIFWPTSWTVLFTWLD